MKLLLYSAVAATLVLSSCSSAYKAAQTPDDVYNSPSSTRVATSRNPDNGSTATTTDDGGTYVTYDDGSQYDSDYGRRMNMFSGNYVSGTYSDYYSAPVGISAYYGSPWYSYYPYSYSGFGFGYGPSYGWGLGFGLGLGFGYGYSPWYSPFYSPYYAYGYPYYGGGYYHGGYYGGGHGYYYSNTVNRIRTNNVANSGSGFTNNGGFIGGRTRTGVVANPNGRSTNVGVGNTRRVFTPASGEQQSGFSRPTRTFSQPSYQAPTRTFSQPTYSAPRSSGGFSGGGGGGFSGGGGGRRR